MAEAEEDLPEPTTTTPMGRMESWADLEAGERKRRAARAVRSADTDTLSDLLAAYLRCHGPAGLRVSDHTLTTYRRGVVVFQKWCEEKAIKPHQVEPEGARRYRAWLQDRYADKTANVYLTAARRLLSALQWAGLADGNAFDGVTVREKTPAKTKADPYSVDELNRLLNAAEPRDCAMVLLAADGGLRLSELQALRPEDIDIERRRLTVQEGKGRKRRRIRITKRLTAALEALEDTGGTLLRVSTPRLKQRFTRLCERAGVNPRGLHNLRHTCGTRLYEQTRDLQAVARHLGHSSTKTAELYAHLAEGDYDEAVDALDSNGAHK